MSELILYISCALATWRLSKMTTVEEGPFGVFDSIRDWADDKFDVEETGWIPRGLRCLWCTSFYFGLVFGLLSQGLTQNAFIYGLSYSALAILFDAVLSKINNVD